MQYSYAALAASFTYLGALCQSGGPKGVSWPIDRGLALMQPTPLLFKFVFLF
jgi:hypothetical protein